MNSFLVEVFDETGNLIKSVPFESSSNPSIFALEVLNSEKNLKAWAYILKINNDNQSILAVLEKNNLGHAIVKSTLFIDQQKIVKSINLSADKTELVVCFTNGRVHHSVSREQEKGSNCDGCRYYACDLNNLVPDTFCENVDGTGQDIIWVPKNNSDSSSIEDLLMSE